MYTQTQCSTQTSQCSTLHTATLITNNGSLPIKGRLCRHSLAGDSGLTIIQTKFTEQVYRVSNNNNDTVACHRFQEDSRTILLNTDLCVIAGV